MSKKIVICRHLDGEINTRAYIVPKHINVEKDDILLAETKIENYQNIVVAQSSSHILEDDIVSIITGGQCVNLHILDKLIPRSTLRADGEILNNPKRKNMKKEIIEIAEHFGYEAQKNMLIEEQAELIQALNKYDRTKTEETFGNIIEEMADVELMIGQVKYLLDINQDAIDEIKEEKIKRIKEKIREEA